ncbi:hypothetical protein FBEOM_11745 [Fusarium beomiforme]|uniref:C2H2-type domain-containing protein n=1 Tax=Fusarium beomiforme TaxID=44412 RepID=A0A9P5A913_9HYPO|nr:hypothetical protein FBEOM_11745 [Fusarium beomiforme]
MDVTTTGGAAGDKPSAKPSLRVTNLAYTGFRNREEDLAHGPLLSGVGVGQEDALISYPVYDPILESSESGLAGESVLPLFPSRLPQLGSAQALSSAPSQSGPSFSVPGSVSYTGHQSVAEWLATYTTQQRNGRSFVSVPEFSWGESSARHLDWPNESTISFAEALGMVPSAQICFDGQQLELPEIRNGQFSRVNPGSERALSMSARSLPQIEVPNSGEDRLKLSMMACIGSFDHSDELWDANDFFENLEVVSTTCSVASDASLSAILFRGEFIEAGLPDHVEIALQKTLEDLVEIIIDEFYRSYAPQRRTASTKGKQIDRRYTRSNNRTQGSVTKKGNKSGCRKPQNLDGDGGSEDEESDRNGEGSSSADGSSQHSRFWACPFIKWDPKGNRKTCVKKLRDIYSLKKHIEDKHMPNRCPDCFQTFPGDIDGIPEHPCIEIYGPPPLPRAGVITKDMERQIKARSDTKMTHREQWERLFKIIFPREPMPSSPYLSYEMAQKLCAAEELFRQIFALPKVCQVIREAGIESHWKRFRELAFEDFLQQCWDSLPTDDRLSSRTASEEEERTEHVQSFPSVDFEMDNYSCVLGLKDCEYDLDETATFQPGLLKEVENTPTLIPEAFDNQPEIGDDGFLARLSAIDTYGSTYSDVAKYVSFQEAENGAFLRPGGGNLPWYEGYETP